MKVWSALALLAFASSSASATTLTTSLAAWQAGVGAAAVTTTQLTGLFDPTALILPTVTSIPLANGASLPVSQPVQIVQTPSGGGGFPYALSDGFVGDLFIPQDALGNQLKSDTITTTGVQALGFEVAPFSSTLGGPYTITLTGSNGQSISATAPGGSFSTGASTPVFLGFFGGGETSVTLSITDPNGLAFGNIRTVGAAAVPEPASLALLASCTLALGAFRRR